MADYGHKINISESSIEFPVEGLFSDINRISSTSTEHLPQYNLENRLMTGHLYGLSNSPDSQVATQNTAINWISTGNRNRVHHLPFTSCNSHIYSFRFHIVS